MKNVNKHPLLSILYLSFFLYQTISATADKSSYVPSDLILLNCGSSSDNSTSNSLYGRKWVTDINRKFVPDPVQQNTTTTSRASANDSSIFEVPYMTARIFHSQFTYTFHLSPGPKFVRLHFYLASYSGLNSSKAFFSVTAGRYTLLNNFNPSFGLHALKFAFFYKEFIINFEEHDPLNITFTPSLNSSTAYAFVNGIEIVSIPSNLYMHGDEALPFVGQKSPFFIDNSTALEMVYRLDVGGKDILLEESTGMFRSWSKDDDYVFDGRFGINQYSFMNTIEYPVTFPAYIAPENVYLTSRSMGMNASHNNLTWIFPVDSGFNYLLRFHFCEIELDITRINEKVFKIFINHRTADDEVDVFSWSGGNGIPVYRDYVVMVPEGRENDLLLLALHPNMETKAIKSDAFLNGLEIFKLSTDGYLARQEMVDPAPSEPSFWHENSKKNPIIIVGGVVGGFFAFSLLCFFVFRICSGGIPLNNSVGKTWFVPSDVCRRFSFSEIKVGTNNFDKALLIGVGGFGNVYRGYIDGGATAVAIKRGNPKSQQGVHEFQTEIEMLSKLRHFHLVSLIGYCQEYREMILVYDYMAHGTLRDHLYKTQNLPLPWKERINICIGAARGLHYLHTGVNQTVIHRDVKTTNILLDQKWVAKVSDFGLSRVGPTSLSCTHVSTNVKGSFGYLDPEYYRRQKLTEKSDVYSFGVVLFEVLCARPAVNPTVEEEQMSLAEWALYCHQTGTMEQIVDPHIRGKIAPECFVIFVEIAKKCLADRGIERPTMGDVLWNLELALQLQCKAEVEESVSSRPHNEIAIVAAPMNLSGDNSIVTAGPEFSEILMPIGR